MKYLKKFENHTAYETYINGSDVALPNVSLCVQQNEVHYNPIEPETRLVCKYNVTSTSSATPLRTNYEQNIFKSMEIDGVQLDSLVTEYTFDSEGIHTVKYELYDETKVGNNAPLFYGIANMIEASIPNNVTIIGNSAFNNCRGLSSVILTSNTPPTLGNGSGNNVFRYTDVSEKILPNLTIYVPSASVNTYKASIGWSDYTSIIQAIPTT